MPNGPNRRIDFTVRNDGDLGEGSGVIRDAEVCFARDLIGVGVGVDQVDMNDLVECSILFGIFLSFPHLSFFQAVRQVRFLSVLDFEVVIDHGVSQPVQGLQLSGTQRGLSGEISV